MSAVPRPSAIILMQEAWSLSHQLWNQPELDSSFRTEAGIEGIGAALYSEWHMWANTSTHDSFITPYYRENLSNAHDEGGNLVFVDGHSEYRKYQKLRSGDFGLLPDVLWKPSARNDALSPAF